MCVFTGTAGDNDGAMFRKPSLNEKPVDTGEEEIYREDDLPANPLTEASWWSRAFFLWPYPLLKLGMERPLAETDIPTILPVDTSRYNRKYLLQLWDRERERCFRKNCQQKNSNNHTTGHEKPSLHRAILKDFFRSMWFVQPFMCIAAAAKVIQAIFLGKLIECFDGGAENGYTFATVIVFCGAIVLMEHRK